MLLAVAPESPDWRELKQIAQQMPEASRKNYLERIEAAEKDSAIAVKAKGNTRWAERLHETKSETLAQEMAPLLCGIKDTVQPLNLAVYTRMLARDVPGFHDETAKNFVNEFRHQLCTAKECAQVKHDLLAVKKLDCPAPN